MLAPWVLTLALLAWGAAQAGAQSTPVNPTVTDGEEWGDIELPPASGSLKISRTPEGVPPPTREEAVLKGVTWKFWGQVQLEASWQKDKDSQGDTSRDTRG